MNEGERGQNEATSPEDQPFKGEDSDRDATIRDELQTRRVSTRVGRAGSLDDTPRRRLNMTKQQQQLLRDGMADLRYYFDNPELWERAANEAIKAEEALGIPNLGAGFSMWTSSMAAMTYRSWWILMPGCGAPVMQDSVCRSLEKPFLERRPEYESLAAAIQEGRYTLLAEVLERTERVRCMLAVHVREP